MFYDFLDPSNEQNVLPVSPSNEAQNWKCRECGFTNRSRSIICDTCETPKPMRPIFESCPSYTKRSPSPSPNNRRSPSPEEETTYYRAGSTSPSRPSPSSKYHINDTIKLYLNSEFLFCLILVDFYYLFTISDSSRKRSSSRESTTSTERDGKHPKDYSTEEKSFRYDGGSYSTSSIDKNNYESKRNRSRTPSPEENNRRKSPDGMHLNTYFFP